MCLPVVGFDLLPVPKGVFLQITGLRTVPTFGGASYTVAEGVRNPWMWVFYLGTLLILVFVVDASVTLWRQGARRRAAVVGGAITFFLLVICVYCALVDYGIVRTPYFLSFAYLAILTAMGIELSDDVLHAAQLARDLRESGERLNLSVEAGNLGLWSRDVARNEIWATEKWRALFGFAAGETLEFNHVMQRLHPDDREAVNQAITKATAEGGAYELEHRIVLPDGGIRWIASRWRVESNGEGKHALMRGVSLDITERRRSEIETQELRQGLAHAGRVTMLGQLASSLAHELSQPLGAILRNTEAAELLLQSDSPDLGEFRAIVSDIHKDDLRAGEVIDRLRSLLKRRDLESKAVTIDSLINEVVALVRSDAVARGVKLETNVAAKLPLVRGDRVQLLQVLLNLIINAMDAVSALPATQRTVRIQAQLGNDGMVELSVTDSGHGVFPEALEKLFEPFYTTKPNGMGMGLPISRTIVEAHGGRLWADNNADHGTKFQFTLAAAKTGGTA